MPTAGRPQHRSFLLRIRLPPDGAVWRASLRSVQDDTTLYFASLEVLTIFLLRQPDTDRWQALVDEQDMDSPCRLDL